MTTLPAEFAALAPLLPDERVGSVLAIQALPRGPSGASLYAVTSTRGELVLKVASDARYASRWAQQLLVLRRAAERGIAPPIVHVDEDARAILSERVAGVPVHAVLADPEQRGRAIGSLLAQLNALHGLERTGVQERDPLALARAEHATQRVRPGFPAWAAELGPIFDAIEAMLAHDPRRAVSHNDLNPGNILWDGTRAWLVDWEVAGLAHPFYDLAVFAMFLRLEDVVAHGLLAQHEQRPIDDAARAAFGALRRLAAVLCGLTFLSLLPDLSPLPASPPTLDEVYADIRAGKLGLQDPRGGAAFAVALLRHGIGTDAAR